MTETNEPSRPEPSSESAPGPAGSASESPGSASAADAAARGIRHRARHAIARKSRQAGRISRTTMRYAVFMCGAAGVALFSLVFAWIAETALRWNAKLTAATPWLAFVMLPFGLAALRWLTIRYAAQARGSGIPQVLAAISLPPDSAPQRILVSFRQAMWKVVLTAAALLAGASVGREGPSVQVGAAAMLSWGRWCEQKLRFRTGFHPNALICAGAAGGLASAFNTPLAGVVFAIEELGRGAAMRWDRVVLSGVLTAGFLTLSLLGNNPYFSIKVPILALHDAWGPVLMCAVVNGVLGGMFAKLLIGGVPGLLPARWRKWPQAHPIWVAFGCGLIVAAIGYGTAGATFGTGYEQASALINGHGDSTLWFGVGKFFATVLSYFAGIPGGIFTPALAIGAGIGDNVAHFLGFLPEPRMLALISMAAFLAAATQAPITASVIVMEMTRTQDLTVFLLASSLLASFLARQFCPHPFYHHMGHAFRREALTVTRRPSSAE
ncbi:chloride channel protein [Cupriavidus plantarum]|uniref:chloride channel protein n=1 Tax=Cupriavidus plantarum TaxID=942865 RepID=UPI0015C88DCE|nr:chloride channel protein [Cupriavidus plantarum]NYI02933.1 H+/Cl- antiporter ClcA [Cupriavidus plantarum]